MKKIWIFFLLSMNTLANAEPIAAITELQNQPASMLDMGLLRASRALDELANKRNYTNSSLNYDYERNLIIINFSQRIEEQPENRDCEAMVGTIREEFLVNPKTGKSSSEKGSRFSYFFEHVGYASKSENPNWRHQIDDMVLITANINDGKKVISCSGKLMSTDVKISKW